MHVYVNCCCSFCLFGFLFCLTFWTFFFFFYFFLFLFHRSPPLPPKNNTTHTHTHTHTHTPHIPHVFPSQTPSMFSPRMDVHSRAEEWRDFLVASMALLATVLLARVSLVMFQLRQMQKILLVNPCAFVMNRKDGSVPSVTRNVQEIRRRAKQHVTMGTARMMLCWIRGAASATLVMVERTVRHQCRRVVEQHLVL